MKELFESPLVWIASSLGGFFAWLGDFTADLFWDIATSAPVLIAIAAIGIAAFVVAHVPTWVDRFFPVAIPYTRAAFLAQFVAAGALVFLLGFRVADDRADLARLKNDLAYSEFMLDQQRQVADEADRLKRESDAEAAAAKEKLYAYQTMVPNPGGKCAEPNGFREWLRPLQRRSRHALARADQPQRNLVARMRALGGKRQ